MTVVRTRRSTYTLVQAAALVGVPTATAYDRARQGLPFAQVGDTTIPVLRMTGLAGVSRYKVAAALLHQALGIPVDADPDTVLAERGLAKALRPAGKGRA